MEGGDFSFVICNSVVFTYGHALKDAVQGQCQDDEDVPDHVEDLGFLGREPLAGRRLVLPGRVRQVGGQAVVQAVLAVRVGGVGSQGGGADVVDVARGLGVDAVAAAVPTEGHLLGVQATVR